MVVSKNTTTPPGARKKKLTAVKVNVNGSVFLTSLEALQAGAKKSCTSDVLSDLVEQAENNPGQELVLDRPPGAVSAYTTIFRCSSGVIRHICCNPLPSSREKFS